MIKILKLTIAITIISFTFNSLAYYGNNNDYSGFGEISEETNRPKTKHIDGYYRKDGTYVKDHYKS